MCTINIFNITLYCTFANSFHDYKYCYHKMKKHKLNRIDMPQRVGKRSFKKEDAKKSDKKGDKKTTPSTFKKKPFSKNKDANKSRDTSKTKDVEKNKQQPIKVSDGDRINKYIAKSGICSRREAEKYITDGLVAVNGKIVTELGTKIYYGDVVKLSEETIKPEKNTYILLNKPKDYSTVLDDPHAKKTVLELIQNGCKERVYPVGRLHHTSTGVLLLTNDGELAENLAHPKSNKKKIYQATLNKNANHDDLQKLLIGVQLEDGIAKVDQISFCEPDDRKEIGLEIHSGKNQLVRRMFEDIGYKVKKLDRVYFAGLTKKNLPRGKWRFLSEKEIVMLKRGTFK